MVGKRIRKVAAAS